MDAKSSSLLANLLHHRECVLASRPSSNKFTSTSFLHMMSLTFHEDKSKQNIQLTRKTRTSRHRLSAKSPLEEIEVSRNGSETATESTKKPPRTASSLRHFKKSPRKLSQPIRIITIIINALDDIVNNFIDPPRRRSVDPKHVLSNNFAPVNELPPTECTIIEGILPLSLNGAYIRNGPNPQHFPRGPYHLFDGDGMLHCLRVSNGRAILCSRFVRTNKYITELEAGSPVFPNFFPGFNGLAALLARGVLLAARVLCGQYDPKKGIGLANTSLASFGEKLFALGESDLPYEIRLAENGDMETIGRYDFEGKFTSMSRMTAHPKIDAQTGEAFAFRFSPTAPFLTYFHFDSHGSKQPDVPIHSMTCPTFIHDFAITKKYAIFTDIQVELTTKLTDLVVAGGSVVRVNSKKVPRIGVIPRYANDESEMRWFEVPGFNNIHAINAWDEEDSIVLIAPNIMPVEHTIGKIELIHALVEKVRIDLKTAIVTRTTISTKNLDFGVINPAFIGRKNKYGYAAVGNPMPKISGVVKLDWSSSGGREVACRMFGSGCYGGEPFFVPRIKDQDHTEIPGREKEDHQEDDGYLVSYVHDENSGESSFLVMDAKSPTLDIVASVKLPHRVPYGFHGLFVSDTDFTKL